MLFDVVEGSDLGHHERRQDDIFRLYHSRLLQNRDLVKKRALVATPQVLTFAHGVASKTTGLADLVDDSATLVDRLSRLEEENLDEDTYRKLIPAAWSVSSIRRVRQNRVVGGAESHGAKLVRLEGSITPIDDGQQRAVRPFVEDAAINSGRCRA